jgi:hypothetical protein
MLTQLGTVKARLDITSSDATHDGFLTRAIEAIGARFDRECNRTLARTVGATQEPVATNIVTALVTNFVPAWLVSPTPKRCIRPSKVAIVVFSEVDICVPALRVCRT